MIDPNNDWESSSGYASPGYGANSSANSGYSTGTYGDDVPGYGNGTASAFGAGSNPWSADTINDGYRENTFQVNWLDTPYTETLSNPNPSAAYQSSYKDQDQLELW